MIIMGREGLVSDKSNNMLKFKYIICIALTALLTIVGFSLFFVFGRGGIINKIISPTQAVSVENDSSEPSDTPLTINPDSEESLKQMIDKYNSYLNSANFILVNQQNAVPSDYIPELVPLSFSEDIKLQKDAAQSLEQFIKDAEAAGIKCTVFSGYRSPEEQQDIYEKKYQSNIDAGYTNNDVVTAKTKLTTAQAGYSEHHTGLAVDISEASTDNATEAENTAFFDYAMQNIYKYGFILRYPEDKKAITGYEYKPWHFRYIGDAEQAKYIMERRISLEEYLDYLKAQIQSYTQKSEELQASKQQ